MENLLDLNPEDESSVVRTDYAGARNLKGITRVIPEGVDHAAPGIDEPNSAFYERHVGKQNQDVEIIELVWAFLKDKNR